MAQEYSIRPYESGDEEGIVQLLQLVFNGWPNFDLDCSPVDHWRWKYLCNPTGESLVIIGESNGEIVGCSHTYLINLKMGERIVKGGFAADAAVHPDYRGKGLWKGLREAKKTQEVDSGLGFRMGITSNVYIMKHHERTLRSTIPYGLTNFMRIRDVDLHLRRRKTEKAWLKKYAYHLMRKVNAVTTFSKPPASEVDVFAVKAFDERMKPFWSRVSGQCDLIVERSLEYLNWRYCDGRGGKFTVKLAGKDEVLGYTVLRANRRETEYPYGVIEDLTALPERSDVVEALLEGAISHFGDGVNVIRCRMLDGHPYTKILKRHGFVNSRDSPLISYDKYVDTDGFDMKQTPVKRMHFVNGDFDWG